jgi:hypothetical protein
MNLKVNLQTIECINDTFGLGKDEIYFACFLTAKSASTSSITQIAKVAVTDIYYKLTRGSVISPLFFINEKDKSGIFNFDLTNINPSTDSIILTFVLYEYDNGHHYNELKKGSLIERPGSDFDWSEIANCFINAIPDKAKMLTCLYKAAKASVAYFPQDDMIDRFSYPIEDSYQEEKFFKMNMKGCGGEYKVNLSVGLV